MISTRALKNVLPERDPGIQWPRRSLMDALVEGFGRISQRDANDIERAHMLASLFDSTITGGNEVVAVRALAEQMLGALESGHRDPETLIGIAARARDAHLRLFNYKQNKRRRTPRDAGSLPR